MLLEEGLAKNLIEHKFRQGEHQIRQGEHRIRKLSLPLIDRDGLPVLGWNGLQAELSISITCFMWNLDNMSVANHHIRLRLKHSRTLQLVPLPRV